MRPVYIIQALLITGLLVALAVEFGQFDTKEAITLTVVLVGVEYVLAKFLVQDSKRWAEVAEAIRQQTSQTQELSHAIRQLTEYLKKSDES